MPLKRLAMPVLAMPRFAKRTVVLLVDGSLCVLAVWFAFYGDASAREVYRRAVGDMDDERLGATVAIITEMILDAGYTGLEPTEAALSIEALFDGLWLNMLLYPADFRRPICRNRAMNVIAALFPKHFQRVTDDKQGQIE